MQNLTDKQAAELVYENAAQDTGRNGDYRRDQALQKHDVTDMALFHAEHVVHSVLSRSLLHQETVREEHEDDGKDHDDPDTDHHDLRNRVAALYISETLVSPQRQHNVKDGLETGSRKDVRDIKLVVLLDVGPGQP